MLLPLLTPVAARADVRFEVSGRAELGPDRLRVVAVVKNAGDAEALDVHVRGELMDALAEQPLGRVGAGEAGEALLLLPPPERSGTHAVALRIEFRVAAKSPPVWQWGYLLVTLGTSPPQPAIRLEIEEARLATTGALAVRVASADGFAHRAAVSLHVPGGLGVLDGPLEVEVPAGGVALARLRLVRGDAAAGSRLGVLALARVLDAGPARDAVATGVVEVRPAPALVPRLRLPLALAGLGLVGWALHAEWRARRGRPA